MKLIIIFIVGAAALLTGCASGPPLAVGEIQAQRYVQKPAAQPYCDQACQLSRKVEKDREREEDAQRARKQQEDVWRAMSPQYYRAMLPDLRRPVYLMKGALSCTSANALAGPPRNEIFVGACALNRAPRRVSVILPGDDETRGMLELGKMARAAAASNDISDATVYSGIVYIRCLSNRRTDDICPITTSDRSSMGGK